MRKKLKDELENRNTVQEYVCPCQRRFVTHGLELSIFHIYIYLFIPIAHSCLVFRYTAFDALQLVSPDDESFRCESCRGELVAESDKFAAEEGDIDDNARKRRRNLNGYRTSN
ncbi:hypothetical protein IFM89_023216 [Coptis chinensis]|uniref:Uncharacterized protein n=1 Tax=Coptis chinensis TaxID=261450 RepID=A0A835I4M9_9MAGN|nr:hypothetical protein IFM89_023216 [Coptis chinensis]